MPAILFSLETFANDQSGKSVLILSDNGGSKAYVAMQGRPIQNLTNIATKTWSFMVQNQIEVNLRQLSGSKNCVVDQLSCYSSKYDCMLHSNIYQYLDTLCGPHTCDRFACYLITQCIQYNSIHADPASSGTDVLVQMDWDKKKQFHKCAFETIRQSSVKIKTQSTVATVIAPEWTAMHWCSKLRDMSTCSHVKLAKDTLFYHPLRLQIPEPFRNKNWGWFARRIFGNVSSVHE